MRPEVDRLATEAVAAFGSRDLRARPAERGDFRLADGYAVSSAADRLLRDRGWRRRGRKLGFTDRSAWHRLGLDRPVWAWIYDATVREDDPSASFDVVSAVAPRLELEVAFGLRAALELPAVEAVIAAVRWAALAFEIVDCHYPDWRFTPPDALADLVFHRALVVGSKRAFKDAADAERWAGSLPVASHGRDGATVLVAGSTSEVMGSPVAALAELVAILRDQGAAPLGAGEVVATGTTTAPVPLGRGQDLTGEIDDRLGLAPVRLRVT